MDERAFSWSSKFKKLLFIEKSDSAAFMFFCMKLKNLCGLSMSLTKIRAGSIKLLVCFKTSISKSFTWLSRCYCSGSKNVSSFMFIISWMVIAATWLWLGFIWLQLRQKICRISNKTQFHVPSLNSFPTYLRECKVERSYIYRSPC